MKIFIFTIFTLLILNTSFAQEYKPGGDPSSECLTLFLYERLEDRELKELVAHAVAEEIFIKYYMGISKIRTQSADVASLVANIKGILAASIFNAAEMRVKKRIVNKNLGELEAANLIYVEYEGPFPGAGYNEPIKYSGYMRFVKNVELKVDGKANMTWLEPDKMDIELAREALGVQRDLPTEKISQTLESVVNTLMAWNDDINGFTASANFERRLDLLDKDRTEISQSALKADKIVYKSLVGPGEIETGEIHEENKILQVINEFYDSFEFETTSREALIGLVKAGHVAGITYAVKRVSEGATDWFLKVYTKDSQALSVRVQFERSLTTLEQIAVAAKKQSTQRAQVEVKKGNFQSLMDEVEGDPGQYHREVGLDFRQPHGGARVEILNENLIPNDGYSFPIAIHSNSWLSFDDIDFGNIGFALVLRKRVYSRPEYDVIQVHFYDKSTKEILVIQTSSQR